MLIHGKGTVVYNLSNENKDSYDVHNDKELMAFFEFFNLMKKLEDDRWITFVSPMNTTACSFVGNIEIKNEDPLTFNDNSYIRKDCVWLKENGEILSTPFILAEDEIKSSHYIWAVPIINEDLRSFVEEDDFITPEDKMIQWSKIAAIVAISALLLSTVLQIISLAIETM